MDTKSQEEGGEYSATKWIHTTSRRCTFKRAIFLRFAPIVVVVNVVVMLRDGAFTKPSPNNT